MCHAACISGSVAICHLETLQLVPSSRCAHVRLVMGVQVLRIDQTHFQLPRRQMFDIADLDPGVRSEHLQAPGLRARDDGANIARRTAGEAEQHRPGVMERLQVSAVPDFENTSAEVTIAAARRNLHAGEIAALSWANAFGTDLFVSDDRMARLAAEDLGYETAGTLGVIRIAAEYSSMARL